MSPPVVVLDANVLYSSVIRSLLIWAAIPIEGSPALLHVRWTERILDEAFRSLRANRPDLQSDKLARTRVLMNDAVEDALIPEPPRTDRLHFLRDPDDEHVLDAAVAAGASRIVTFNVADFPASAGAPYGVVVQTPDALLIDLTHRDESGLLDRARRDRAARNPPRIATAYVDRVSQELPVFGDWLRDRIARI